MRKHVPEDCRTIRDVAISGNGEPTSCRQFDAVVEIIVRCVRAAGLLGRIPVVLITNGSYVHRPELERGLRMMAAHKGEVWFKVDSATQVGIARINGVKLSSEWVARQLDTVASCCPTYIQTCMFAWDGKAPDNGEVTAYLDFLRMVAENNISLKGVLLYGIARPSMQPEAARVSALDIEWMQGMKHQIEEAGLPVRLTV